MLREVSVCLILIIVSVFLMVFDSLRYRQRFELEELRRQLEENSALAGRALREELEKAREEQERKHQVKQRIQTIWNSAVCSG